MQALQSGWVEPQLSYTGVLNVLPKSLGLVGLGFEQYSTDQSGKSGPMCSARDHMEKMEAPRTWAVYGG